MCDRGFDLWLEFEHWVPQDGDDAADDFFNLQVKLADGRAYALNVWTFEYLSRAVRECHGMGEHLGGSYLPAPDLFVERLDRELLEGVVSDLIANGGLLPHWEVRVEQEGE